MSTRSHNSRIAAIRERLAKLPTEKRTEILAALEQHLLRGHLAHGAALLSHAPLTAAQQRIWVLEQFERAPGLYHVPFIWRLQSRPDLSRLQNAFSLLLSRHPQLACQFTEENQTVTQSTLEGIRPPITQFHLPVSLSSPLRVTKDHPLAAFFLQPFDLCAAPLFRIAEVNANGTFYLALCFHHLIMDAWSARQIFQELSEWYATSILPPMPLNSYADYVKVEMEKIQQEAYGKELAYWERRLEKITWQTDLMTDYPRKSSLTGKGDNHLSYLTEKEGEHLREYARKNRVSVNHVILSVFQFFLARHSQQNQITLGIPVALREFRWIDLPGLFVNTCVHTICLDYAMNFKTWLGQTGRLLTEDIAHAGVPYDCLRQWFYRRKICQPDNIFNILYNFIEGNHDMHPVFDGERAEPVLCLLPLSKFDLSLHVFMHEKTPAFLFEYSTDLFTMETVSGFAKHFLYYLNSLIQQVGIDDLSLSELTWALDNPDDSLGGPRHDA